MEPTKKGFLITVYIFLGRTFLCPNSSLEEGALVASITPLSKVDPLNKYQYVIDVNDSHSVSRTRLKRKYIHVLTVNVPPCTTHNAEVLLKIKVVQEFLKKQLAVKEARKNS